MVNVEDYSKEENVEVERSVLKLGAGQRVRNVSVTGCIEGVSEYGSYTLVFLEADGGEQLSLLLGENVFGTNGVAALTIGEPGSKTVNPAILGKKIWIGKTTAIASKKKAGKSYFNFEYGFE